MGLAQSLLVLTEKFSMAVVISCSGCRMLMKHLQCANLAEWVTNQLGYWKPLKRKQ